MILLKNSINLKKKPIHEPKSYKMKKRDPYNWMKWIARVISIILVTFTLFMVIGEFVEGQNRNAGQLLTSFPPLIMVIFFVWGIALAGLIVGFWKEGVGGLISFGSFMLVYILNLFNKEASMRGSAIGLFLIFSIPAILYLIYWKLRKDDSKMSGVKMKKDAGLSQ